MTAASSPARPMSRGLGAVRGPRLSGRARQRLTVWLLLGPCAIGFALFFVYPLITTVYYSFTIFDFIGDPRWTGGSNYVYMATRDPLIWTAIGNTAWFTIVITAVTVTFAICTAVILTKIKHGAGIFRTLFYLPSLVPSVATALIFVFLLNPSTGFVNTALAAVGIKGPLWFNDAAWAKPALAIMALWGTGNLMVIFLAALLDVPKELYEAAEMDGAGPWRRFWSVTMPSLTPVLTFALVTSLIGGLQYFTEALVAGAVASGSPTPVGTNVSIGYPDNSTLTFPMWLYQQGFKYYNMGYASAMAVVLFLIAAVVSVFLVRRMRYAGITEEDDA